MTLQEIRDELRKIDPALRIVSAAPAIETLRSELRGRMPRSRIAHHVCASIWNSVLVKINAA